MREKKQLGKHKRLLSLLLAIVLICGMIPTESVLALENETSPETEAITENEISPETEAITEEVTEQDTGTELDDAEVENTESDSEEKLSEETEEPTEPTITYANSISGVLWLDANTDGIKDNGEQPVADYPVYLYLAGDISNAVHTVKTGMDGRYTFKNIESGSYVVGIKSETIDGTEYLLPLGGIANDNKFAIDTSEWIYAYTEIIEIESDSEITDMDAGLRTPPGIQPMANTTYTIDLSTITTMTAPTGTSYSGNVLTFLTGSVDPTDTYIITQSTTPALTRRIVVQDTVTTNITLDGVNITNAASPITLLGTANVTLTLANGKNNTLRCTYNTANASAISAGISVPYTSPTNYASLTINGDTGTLNVTGGIGGAGIGGNYGYGGGNGSSCGTVTITGGTVTATGGSSGAGIGGGWSQNAPGASGGIITISNATVTAATGGNAAGIGGGYSTTGADGGTITITNATVTATSNSAAGIGGGYCSGIGADGGIITITSSTVIAKSTATGGYSAGIGGGVGTTGGSGGTITITDSIVTATSGDGGAAGIGGGRGQVTGGSGGKITISDSTVTATAGTWGAGIGGGWAVGTGGAGADITITSGTVIATSSGSDGVGIGGGKGGNPTNSGIGGAGGIVTITGGTVIATGSGNGVGIGGGYGTTGTGIGGTGADVTITGGTVIAKSGNVNGTGIGGGYASGTGNRITTGTNIFTSGSIYSANSTGIIKAATDTTNGSANGMEIVYCVTVTVYEGDGITPVEGALVTIPNLIWSGYDYTAYTNASGIAYCWIPATAPADQFFEAEDDVHGYGCEDEMVDTNNTNAVTIILGMRTTLSRTPDTITFKANATDTPVTLNVKAENNIPDPSSKDIVDMQWYRVETTDTTYTRLTFDAGYAAALPADKGTDDGTLMVEKPGGTISLKEYSMDVSENGLYWVKMHYKDKYGVDRYQVKSIVIDNIYTKSELTYKGVNAADNTEIVFGSTTYVPSTSKDYGVAFELNSATSTKIVINSTADGENAVPNTDGSTYAQITLTAPVKTPIWTSPAPASYTVDVDADGDLGEKIFKYTLNPLAITVKFDSQNTPPDTIPNQYYMSGDNFGTLPAATRGTTHTFDGWFTTATAGTKVTAADAVSTYFTAGQIVTLYGQWKINAVNLTISKTITGTYADMTKDSMFTITFKDSSGTALAAGTTITYTGGIITGSGATAPSSGTRTLDSNGQTTTPITLKHGQIITITGVAADGKVQVVETAATGYTTTYTDNVLGAGSGNDTTMLDMTGVDRTFAFTNTRNAVTPAGISLSGNGMTLLAVIALAIGAGAVITMVYRRRRRAG